MQPAVCLYVYRNAEERGRCEIHKTWRQLRGTRETELLVKRVDRPPGGEARYDELPCPESRSPHTASLFFFSPTLARFSPLLSVWPAVLCLCVFSGCYCVCVCGWMCRTIRKYCARYTHDVDEARLAACYCSDDWLDIPIVRDRVYIHTENFCEIFSREMGWE